MGSLNETNRSLWVGTTADEPPASSTPTLPARVDVAVIGGGIAGLTTARLLAAEGASVAVIEAGRLCAGATAYTTAKVTALQRTTASEIRQKLGDERAFAYVAANAAAVERVAALVSKDAIDCDFERAPACTYTEVASEVGAVEAEFDALRAAGLTPRLEGAVEVPLDAKAGVWLDNQAQFHPRKYCLGLADAIAAAGGTVIESARATEIDESADGAVVRTALGEVRAGHVIVATHLPFPLDGAYFARAHAYRSYALAVRADPQLAAMYISVEEPTRSLRRAGEWTIVGGEGHKVGHDEDSREYYNALESWARERYGEVKVGYRWSAQDYETVDGMPYIGRLSGDKQRVWTATGFRKWGMTNGTVAAMILTDLISGRGNEWAEAFDSTRLAPGASIKSLVTENLEVGKRFVADRLKALGKKDAPPRCTHLGCLLNFNTAEQSWDCPCHGSRFGVDGRVLEGPAVEDLSPLTDI
jgi:glycine/D-amino acid oxidase-like deaminating enzyme